jgi:thymidine phosphorylase
MSKKLAEGIDALVLDVKTGSGAFMKKEEDAVFLAELMVETGERMRKSVVALITNMDQPLGTHVGNSLEVIEALEVLHGRGPDDLKELCVELAGWMFHLGGAAATVAQGKRDAEQLIASGKAFDKFRQMVSLQGGDVAALDDPTKLPRAKYLHNVLSPRSGFITAMNCEAIGTACVVLGGGREKKEDAVDPAVGIVLHRKIADQISVGEPLCTIHSNSEARTARAESLLLESFHIADAPAVEMNALVRRVIRGSKANSVGGK